MFVPVESWPLESKSQRQSISLFWARRSIWEKQRETSWIVNLQHDSVLIHRSKKVQTVVLQWRI